MSNRRLNRAARRSHVVTQWLGTAWPSVETRPKASFIKSIGASENWLSTATVQARKH